MINLYVKTLRNQKLGLSSYWFFLVSIEGLDKEVGKIGIRYVETFMGSA